MRERMNQFMMGRYGADELSKVLSTSCIVLLVVSLFSRINLLYFLALALLVYSYYRMFSTNVTKRYEENQKYLTWRYKQTVKWNNEKKHWAQRHEYHFYKCPQCKQKVRVPRGKGRISITCPKCRNEFVKKS